MSTIEPHATVPQPLPSLEPHGSAALSLVESLIHFLIEQSAITRADASEVVQIALDAQTELGWDRGDDPTKPSATALLSAIAASLAIDAG